MLSFVIRSQARVALSLLLLLASTAGWSYDPASGNFAKPQVNSVRIMTWNVEKHFIADSTVDENFRRIIQVLQPDVIAFQEIQADLAPTAGEIATAIKTRLESYTSSTTWNVYIGLSDNFNRNAIASRFPLSLQRNDTIPASEVRGVTMALVDLPTATFGTRDLYLMNVHMKSGGTTGPTGDHARRQRMADAVVSWMRDARLSGGSITLAANTSMVLLGDTNLGYQEEGDEAPYHASRTLRDGTIYDTATFGASSLPDWDATILADAAPYDPITGNPRTQPANTSSPSSRLDRIIYTDSTLHVVGKFILNTRTLSSSARTAAGLQFADTSGAADHLPVVVDFAPGPDPQPAADVLINEFSFNDLGADDRTFIELYNTGGRAINLDAPADYWLKSSNSGLPTSSPASANENAGYDLQGVIPPGGYFVIYDAAGDSAAIASTIQANLPSALQRQDLGTAFMLSNFDNTAFAIVEQGRSDISVTSESLVEAYGYAATNASTTRYFRTASGNNLTIALGSAQWTSFGVAGAASDLTLSRLPGNTQKNSYSGWATGVTATPGLLNSTNSSIADWSLYSY